jgi:hypothetical protein
MTTASERTRAVLATREFLEEMAKDEAISKSVRARACGLLRHYPSTSHLDVSSAAFPHIWCATRTRTMDAPTYLQLLQLWLGKETTRL